MTESQFIDLVRQNIKNQMFDVLIMGGLMSLLFILKANAPDDDEDPAIKNRFKFAVKMTDKFKDELSYFYDPTSLTSLVGSGIFPAVGLIEDYKKILSHTLTEVYGLTIEDDELVESNKTIKYWMNTFPVINQASKLLPLFYPDTAKDLGIDMKAQYGIK